MHKQLMGLVAVLAATGLVLGTLWAQVPGGGPRGGPQQQQQQPGGFKPPDDARLTKLHEEFVRGAEKLALEYEQKGDIDKARDCYDRILRLVPTYSVAKEKLASLHDKEATAEKRVVDVMANKGWQPTGIFVMEGKPIIITATGKWNFRVSYDLGPEGIAIPKELRDFNLGALIGAIQTTAPGMPRPNGESDADNKPFFIGEKREITPSVSGQLLLRMYDADPADNAGKISVMITGTFGKK